MVLAGDHKQLAPTVKSQAAEAGRLAPSSSSSEAKQAGRREVGGVDVGVKCGDGLGLTMFDRVLRDHGQEVCRMLDVQYRMNRDICDWASREVGVIRRERQKCTRTSVEGEPEQGGCSRVSSNRKGRGKMDPS